MSFDPTKPVQTRDGRKALILANDLNGDFPLLGVIIQKGLKCQCSWTEQGRSFLLDESRNDLVNVPDYPPLPDVEGGRLEYRGKGIKGLKSPYWVARGPINSEWYRASPEDGSVGSANYHYAEFIPDAPELVPYTLETWPMWATRIRVKGRNYHGYVGRVTSEGVQVATQYPTDYSQLLADYEIAGVDGEWHPAGQEVSK